MPKQVRGEDGRVLHRQLGDHDAHELALRVNRETGETISLVPWVFNGEEYVLEEQSASVVATPADEPEVVEEPEIEPEPEPEPEVEETPLVEEPEDDDGA